MIPYHNLNYILDLLVVIFNLVCFNTYCLLSIKYQLLMQCHQ